MAVSEKPVGANIDEDMLHQAEAGNVTPAKEEVTEDESKYPTGLALWSILGPVTIAYFLIFLDMCVVSTATPAITLRFNSLIDVGWYGGAYQLGSSSLQPLTGKIYSHFNTKVGSHRGSNPPPPTLRDNGDLILISYSSGPSSYSF